MQGLCSTAALLWALEKARVGQPMPISSPPVWVCPITQGLHSMSALFWGPEKARVRQPIMISFPFVWGSPRIKGLRSTSALVWAPGKAGMRYRILFPFPFVGHPQGRRGYIALPLSYGPPRGRVEAANANFVPLYVGIPKDARVT